MQHTRSLTFSMAGVGFEIPSVPVRTHGGDKFSVRSGDWDRIQMAITRATVMMGIPHYESFRAMRRLMRIRNPEFALMLHTDIATALSWESGDVPLPTEAWETLAIQFLLFLGEDKGKLLTHPYDAPNLIQLEVF